MNIFYIYVLLIAIYFSLCQMSYEEIELNFGEDNSNKMFIRTINETHVIVGTEKNIAILDLVNKELKNDSIFSSIIINGMIEPFLVNTTDMKILIYEDIEHNSHGYNLNTKEKFSHGNYFNKIHSINFYKTDRVFIIGEHTDGKEIGFILFEPKNEGNKKHSFLEVSSSYEVTSININDKLLIFYYYDKYFSVAMLNETEVFSIKNELSLTIDNQNDYKISHLLTINIQTDYILGVFFEEKSSIFYAFLTQIGDTDPYILKSNILVCQKIDAQYYERINDVNEVYLYLYKMNDNIAFFAFQKTNTMYYRKITIDIDKEQLSFLQLNSSNYLTTTVINENIVIFGKKKDNKFYAQLHYYPFCLGFSRYPKYNITYNFSKAFTSSDESEYLVEKIKGIYIQSDISITNEYQISHSIRNKTINKNTLYDISNLFITIYSNKRLTIQYSTSQKGETDDDYQECSLVFIPCDVSCLTCIEETNECRTCDNDNKYYQLEDDPSTCKKGEIEGYYFSEELYKKCPEGCLKCNSFSTCFKCNITGGFYPQKQKDNYVTCYNDTSKPLRTYIDKEKKEVLPCYYSCENCTGSMYSSKHNCLRCIDKYFFIDDFETNCLSEGNQPLNYYLNTTNSDDIRFKKCYQLCRTCSSYGDSSNHNCDSCISPYIIATGSVTKNCILTSDIKPTFEYLQMFVPLGHKQQDELKFVTIDDNFSFIYYIQGALIKNGTFPYLSLDFCEKILSNNNKDNKLLYIGIIYNKNQRDNLTYQIYNSNGKEIEINSFCSEETITKSYPIIKNNTKTSLLLGILHKISQSNLEDLYNPSSSFYTQPCSYANFLTEDASIEVRQNMYQYDLTFCPDNCENKGYNQITQMLLCKCTSVNDNKVGSISEPNKKSNFPNITHSTSFYLFSCSSLLSEFPGSGENMMHWYILVYIIVDIVLIFTFIQSQNKSFQNSFYQRRSLSTFPAAPVKNKDLTEGIELPEIKSNSNDSENNEDKNSIDIEITRKNGLKPSMLEIMRQNIDEYNLTHKKFSKEELNILSIEEAVYRDKRNIFEYLLDIILEKVFILSIFTNYNSYYPNCVKFSIHLLVIILLFFFTAGFFSDADSTNRFNTSISNELNYILSNELSIIFHSFLASFFILNFLDSLMSSYCSIYHYSQLFIKGRSRYKNLLRIIAIKSIIVYIICAVIGGLCWYFLYIFGYMRKQIQTVIVIHSCFAILFIILSQIIIAIIASIFRIIGMVCKSKIIFYIGIVFYFFI